MQKRLLAGSAILILNFFIINGLSLLFPYTGLRAIVVYPVIIVLNSVLIFGTILLTKNINGVLFGLILSFVTVTMVILTISLHPQEFRPNAFKQIAHSISAIKNFENSPLTDLDLPFTVQDFSRYDCDMKDSEERYIVALYKYRNTIPLDGSFKVYREEKTGAISYDYDLSVKKIDDIPRKLKTGQDKLIWWILERLEK